MTALFLVGLLCLIAGFDLLTLKNRGMETTISRVLRSWGEAWGLFPYLIAFALGALIGHLFL